MVKLIPPSPEKTTLKNPSFIRVKTSWKYLSLTLRVRTVFKIFEKTQPISLYWFAAQQQTSTSRRQKFDLFYSKLVSEFNELSLKF